MRVYMLNATVHSVARLRNSASGNPRWLLDTDQGQFRTGEDSACGAVVDHDWADVRVLLTVTAGVVTRLTVLP